MEQCIDMTDSAPASRHLPVLLTEVCEFLKVKEGGIYFDGTFGGGGHSKAILEANSENIVIACDKDLRAIERGRSLVEKYRDRLILHHGAFSNIDEYTEKNSLSGALVDLGMSTDQLFEKRGFSFSEDAPLDMRMDESVSNTATKLISNMSERELAVLLKKGGLRQGTSQMAKAIAAKKGISTTKELSEIAAKVLRSYFREKDTNPATVVFQALRIAVNREFEELAGFISALPSRMKQGARAAVISFHSLEDQIVTKAFRGWAEGDTTPPSIALFSKESSIGSLLTKKAVSPSEDEVRRNPAARSARLRVFEFRSLH